jgi:hypothetical protein
MSHIACHNAAGLTLLAALAAAPAAAITFGPPPAAEFPWSSPLIARTGSAHVVTTGDGQILRLTDDVPSQAGTAFFINPYSIGKNSDIRARFRFRVSSDPGNPVSNRSDGFAFILGGLPAAPGMDGQGLGYAGNPAFSESVIVEFDTFANAFDPSASHVAVTEDGQNQSALASRSTSRPMDNGDLWEVQLQYYGKEERLDVLAVDLDLGGGTFLTRNIDLLQSLNCGIGPCDGVYFGFTGATGSGHAAYDVLSMTLAVPEPGSVALLPLGLAALAFSRRRARAQP